MDEKANRLRGNKPLKPHIDLESFIEYVKVMLNVKTEELDGVEYLKGWLPNLLTALKEVK